MPSKPTPQPNPLTEAEICAEMVAQIMVAKDSPHGTAHRVIYHDGQIDVVIAIAVGDDARWLAEQLGIEE